MSQRVAILGAGLCGNLLAILLARRGIRVVVFERSDGPAEAGPGGRSINLALAARGIRALEVAAAFEVVAPLLLPLEGRIVHAPDGTTRFLAYGQRPGERIWSVSRRGLNLRLLELARDLLGVEYRFGHECIDVDADSNRVTARSPGGPIDIDAELVVAADGAGSVIRRRLAAAGCLRATESLLDHGYRELTIPAQPDGRFAFAADGLHIWPRGGYMLIALPNPDGTFTATLFLPHRGRPGFDTLRGAGIEALFREQFADALPLMPNLTAEFEARPVGELGTVDCEPWHHRSRSGDRMLLLIGDAAHAIVPFHGQGMNAAFEDCVEFARLVDSHGPDWPGIVDRFESARRANTRAIAAMALENYVEMRDGVLDPDFERRTALAFELERRHGERFIPRYSMVMFHPEIPYAEAERRGSIQAGILDEAMRAADDDVALEIATQLVAERL